MAALGRPVNLDWPKKVIHLGGDDTEAYRDIQRHPAASLSVTHVETHTHTHRQSAWCQSHHSLPVSHVDLVPEMRSGKQTFTGDKWRTGSDRRFLVWRLAVNQIYCCSWLGLLCTCILYLLISLWRECVPQSSMCVSSISDSKKHHSGLWSYQSWQRSWITAGLGVKDELIETELMTVKVMYCTRHMKSFLCR